MSPFARELFRRIALGLPLAGVGPGGVLVATLTACPCPGAPAPVRHTISSDERAAVTRADGTLDPDLCRELCARIEAHDLPRDGGGGDAGALTLTSAANDYARCTLVEPSLLECAGRAAPCIGGRAPSGLCALPHGTPSLGAHLARAAWFEAASVFAFEDLAHELGMHGAPRALVQRAWSAAQDERRHARIFAELAAREGAPLPAVERTASRPRTLRALAEDNATEGLGREAFATLVAMHQAGHATDRRIARASATLVPDEARHALLSADVQAWVVERLGPGVAAACDERRRAMLAELVDTGDASALDAPLGLPDRSTRARFAVALS